VVAFPIRIAIKSPKYILEPMSGRSLFASQPMKLPIQIIGIRIKADQEPAKLIDQTKPRSSNLARGFRRRRGRGSTRHICDNSLCREVQVCSRGLPGPRWGLLAIPGRHESP
jgi:hypothetical protein